MTFALHKINITNFRAYKGTHSFEFPTASGIYYFTGRNKADDIGANGAGKTTFMDAITWCLYGVTTRGLKAADVLSNWETAGCVVELELTVGDQRSTVKRTQKPNSLTLDGRAVDQEDLEKYLRLPLRAFLHSVLNAQFGTSFFSLAAAAKLTLFSDIMRLEYWIELSKEAARQADELQSQIDALWKKRDLAKGRAEYAKEDLNRTLDYEADFEVEKEGMVEALKLKAADIYEEQRRAGEAVTEAKGVRDRLTPLVKKAAELERSWEIKRDSILERMEDIRKSIATRKAEIKRLSDERSDLDIFCEGKCPTCHQNVDARHISLARNGYDAEIKDSESRLTSLNDKHKALLDKAVQTKLDLEAVSSEAEDLRKQLTDAGTAILLETAKCVSIGEKAVLVAAQITEMKKRLNPYTAMIADKEFALKDIKGTISAITENIQKLQEGHEAISYWVKGFKRVRLYIIEQAFQALEIEVNNSLAQLGMKDWQITFEIERENKSGGVTKGFMVLIKGPRNKQPVKWENWSGGETQRLQLAGDLGLANLIMQQAGLTGAVEFYDEPSTHLSPEGMMDLADTLHERAVTENKCIWIVDHTSISNFGEFEGVIIARKDSNGISTIGYDKPA